MAILVAPSILAADFGAFREAAERARDAGADWLHVDVMDGHFVPNLTFGPGLVAALRAVDLPLDVHLMIDRPEAFVPAFAAAGAHRLTLHAEATRHLHRALQAVREAGCRPGVALNPATPWTAVEPVLGLVDLVLVMTVNPGFGGQAFLPETLPKVRALRRALGPPGPGVPWLQVDGGITAETAPRAVEAGADVLVAGTAVFGAADPGAAIASLRRGTRGGSPGSVPAG